MQVLRCKLNTKKKLKITKMSLVKGDPNYAGRQSNSPENYKKVDENAKKWSKIERCNRIYVNLMKSICFDSYFGRILNNFVRRRRLSDDATFTLKTLSNLDGSLEKCWAMQELLKTSIK